MNILKQWSNKNTLNIIFYSKIDGNGSNNVLYNKVFNKSNLYFISFDGDNNIYGGYVNTKIDKCNFIYNRNISIFSLIRNGEVNNKRYFLRQGVYISFSLCNNDSDNALYGFGTGINVCKVGSNQSFCNNNEHCLYEYNNDNEPLTDISYPDRFVVQRIVVIEMN